MLKVNFVSQVCSFILTGASSWKEAIEKRIDQIEKSMVSSAGSTSSVDNHDCSLSQTSSEANIAEEATQSVRESVPKPLETSQEAALNLSCGLGAFPASSLKSLVHNDKGIFSSGGPDLVDRGVISQQTSEKHFTFYRENLNPYIHHLLTDDDTLASVQRRSSLLLAAICTTAAFCAGSSDYHTCFDAFIHEVSAKMFTSIHSFDDVRALCIGAFWLGNASSALNALGESQSLNSLA